MQLTKPCFSMYAEDFGLMKQYLTAEDIIDMLTALQDLCILGESEYQPKTPKQQYCWDKLRKKFDIDLAIYRTSVENGKKGGRPKKENPDNNPGKTCAKTRDETHLTLDTCHLTKDTCLPDSCNKSSLNSDLSVEVANRLADLIRQKKAIKIHAQQKTTWAKEIDLLSKRDGISDERIKKAIEWYEQNAGGQYVPVIESGKAFREKFIKLEDAIKRSPYIPPEEKKQKEGKKTLVAEEWEPKKETVDKLQGRGLDPAYCIAQYKNACIAKGLKYINHDRALLSWNWGKEAQKQELVSRPRDFNLQAWIRGEI